MALISAFQKNEPVDWSGLTTENHLGAMYNMYPELVSNLVDRIYDVNLGLDIDRFMDKFPVHYISDDVEFEWFLQGSDLKNIPLISVTDSGLTALAKPGVGFSRFYVLVPERYFEETDVIGFPDKENYQAQVKSAPTAFGTNWLYECELITGDATLYLPAAQIAAGVRLVKMYSLTEQTLSKKGGTTNHTSPFRMQNRCSQIRMQVEVPGNMINKGSNSPLSFHYKDTNGNVQTTWIGKLDFDFLTQFKRQKALMCLYTNSNKTAQGTYAQKGASGFELKVGGGIY
jgi:hypothetical protein